MSEPVVAESLDVAAAPAGSEAPVRAVPSADGGSVERRTAAWAFAAYVAVALPVIVYGLGRYHWFLGDDWDFLTLRDPRSADDLLRPHAEHWSTIPILLFRVEWKLFGLDYRGYQVLVVCFHLAVAVLLRLVMRRSGVSPWVATAAAAIFVLFGPGQQNILWSFQIGMTGSLLFGLLHLLGMGGASGDRPGRRDGLALLAGFAAVLCSGVGVVMIGVVGLAALIGRSWRVAAFHTVPVAIAYLAWFAAYGDDAPQTAGHISPSTLVRWLDAAFRGTISDIGSGPVLGALIVLVAVAGLVLVARSGPSLLEVLRGHAAVAALAVGALAFQAITANSRWAFDVAGGRTSRYVHVTAALLLPAIALGFDGVARRWRWSTPVLVLLLLAPLPGNIRAFDPDGEIFGERYFDRNRNLVEAMAWSTEATQVPRSARPIRDIFGGEGPPIGWLLDAKRAGKVPRPEAVSDATYDELRMRLGVGQSFEPADDADERTCRTYDEPLLLDPPRGESFTIRTDVGLRLRDAREPSFLAFPYQQLAGEELTIQLDDLPVTMSPLAPATEFVLCR